MGDSLLEGSAQLPTNPCLNGKTILAEREGSIVVEVKRGVYSQPHGNHAVPSFLVTVHT